MLKAVAIVWILCGLIDIGTVYVATGKMLKIIDGITSDDEEDAEGKACTKAFLKRRFTLKGIAFGVLQSLLLGPISLVVKARLALKYQFGDKSTAIQVMKDALDGEDMLLS